MRTRIYTTTAHAALFCFYWHSLHYALRQRAFLYMLLCVMGLIYLLCGEWAPPQAEEKPDHFGIARLALYFGNARWALYDCMAVCFCAREIR